MLRKRDFAYDLPDEQIAQAPADRRDGSRLLEVGADEVADRGLPDIISLIPADAVVVVNDTKVIPARLHARKDTGGAVELLLVEPSVPGDDRRWLAMARSSKPLRPGIRLTVHHRGQQPAADAPVVTISRGRDDDGIVEVELPGSSEALLGSWGEVPLPPYIARPGGSTATDLSRYQTVYAREAGAVAAPTAGLHLTDAILQALRDRGAAIASLTLHVGLGTFAPIRADELDDHEMHRERYRIPEATAALVTSGRPVVAVGTTVVRALEASAASHGRVRAGAATTDLFIRDGFCFRAVDGLLTNFHLPESTLLMLVCAFGGHQRVMAAYRHAVAAGYRFYSYGDAMYLERAS